MMSSTLRDSSSGIDYEAQSVPPPQDEDEDGQFILSLSGEPRRPDDSLFVTTSTQATPSSSRGTVVDSARIRRRSVAVNGDKTAVDILQHVPNILKPSHSFQQVSEEQIERIRTMHKTIEKGAKLSFNYNTLLAVASILAGIGLVSDSNTTVIASMLVSPIMGPVIGMAYGATVFDWKLCWLSLKTEVISLIFCIGTGALVGACTGWTNLANSWPTPEMVTRATLQNFLLGLPIAFFSGLGVAVSVLDDSTSSLVGVAISASLLPPAVNAGILWVAYGFASKNWLGTAEGVGPALPTIVPLSMEAETDEPQTVAFEDFDGGGDPGGTYDEAYILSKQDFWQGGAISLSLTLANIVLVCLASVIMFRIKERLPIDKKVFWDDLGVARKIFRELASVDSDLEDFRLASEHGTDSFVGQNNRVVITRVSEKDDEDLEEDAPKEGGTEQESPRVYHE